MSVLVTSDASFVGRSLARILTDSGVVADHVPLPPHTDGTLAPGQAELVLVGFITPEGAATAFRLLATPTMHRPHILVLPFPEPHLALAGRLAGACACCSLHEEASMLVGVVHRVLAGRAEPLPALHPREILTASELRAIQAVATGNGQKAASDLTGTSPSNLARCLGSARRRIGVRSTTALIVAAVRRHLLAVPPELMGRWSRRPLRRGNEAALRSRQTFDPQTCGAPSPHSPFPVLPLPYPSAPHLAPHLLSRHLRRRPPAEAKGILSSRCRHPSVSPQRGAGRAGSGLPLAARMLT